LWPFWRSGSESVLFGEVLRTSRLLRSVACFYYGELRWDRGSVLWCEIGRSDQIRRVVAACVNVCCVLGRCFVRVFCCVLQVIVVMECIRRTVRVCGGVNDVVAVECGV